MTIRLTHPEKSKSAWDVAHARWRKKATTLTDAEIKHDLLAFENHFCEFRREVDEDGGMAGSPGEWMYERMSELETEQSRRTTSASTG